MRKKLMLDSKKLRACCRSEAFDFNTTEEVKPFTEGIIGQQRAVKAMGLGLRMNREGYNIFMSGITGTGKSTYAKRLTKKHSKKYDVPPDLCYVFNFENPEKASSLKLPAGYGIQLQNDMENLVAELKEELPKLFESEEYEDKKKDIMNSYQQESNRLMEDFENKIKKDGFTLQNTSQGLIPVPVDEDDNPINQEEFQQLDDERRNQIREKSQKIQNEMEQVMRKIRTIKAEAQEELEDLEKKMGLSVVQPVIDNLKNKFEDCQQIIDYLEDVQKDVIRNLEEFIEDKNEKKMPIPFKQKDKEDFFTRYKINLLVSNRDSDGAPVVFESNPTYYNLFGKIEAKGQFGGSFTTDFTMIKRGAIHKANGGYLIIKARDILTKPFAWETMKRILINQEIAVENIGEQYRTVPIATLKTEPIAIDIKVIMVGNPMIYQLLYNYDEEFKKLFKIRADFDVEMERSHENMNKFASFIASISKREGIRHFTTGAVIEVIEYSSRLTGDKNKMSTRFNEIMELLYEADAWADSEDNEYVKRENVIKAIIEKENRSNLAEEKIQEMIERDHLLVDVEGKEVGQINGLAVYQSGQYSFGRPSRITARTYLGKEGVINIEREAKMSGKIHNKGVLILSGYLGGKYAQDKPLSLSASLAFEQSYGGVDGDSASCTELIALLSAISGIPVKQEMAITGSMNQKGIVQPIGGVNQKIEGFYKVCEAKGLTGSQGVVIPEQNVDNLMLKQEVVEAVKENKFRIYSVRNIDEAIELMMDKPAAEVHEKVSSSLREFARKVAEFNEGTEESEENGVEK